MERHHAGTELPLRVGLTPDLPPPPHLGCLQCHHVGTELPLGVGLGSSREQGLGSSREQGDEQVWGKGAAANTAGQVNTSVEPKIISRQVLFEPGSNCEASPVVEGDVTLANRSCTIVNNDNTTI